jgi:hypothetical protein
VTVAQGTQSIFWVEITAFALKENITTPLSTTVSVVDATGFFGIYSFQIYSRAVGLSLL